MIHPKVSTKYTLHIHLALVLSLGCIFERMGPVASAENTRMEPLPIEGSTAMVKNTIPSPPIHCDSDRQKSMAWCELSCCSTSSSTEAPVVVNPDMVSKKASVGLRMMPLNI